MLRLSGNWPALKGEDEGSGGKEEEEEEAVFQ